MYKSQYTPEEAQEQFRIVEESSHHDARKERMKRYIQNRIVGHYPQSETSEN